MGSYNVPPSIIPFENVGDEFFNDSLYSCLSGDSIWNNQSDFKGFLVVKRLSRTEKDIEIHMHPVKGLQYIELTGESWSQLKMP